MSDDQPVPPPALLRREALLPTERNRGLGTVAIVCTMAGVASGLALATTLMAMQVADSMSMRGGCPYHERALQVDLRGDAGFLGVTYGFEGGAIEVDKVVSGTPADAVALRHGDRIISMDGVQLRSMDDFGNRIAAKHPGTQVTFVVDHGGKLSVVAPTLVGWPTLSE